MPLDWNGLMYDPVYSTLGVAAVLEIDSADHDLTVIDKTSPVSAGDNIEMQTFFPSVTVRAKELVTKSIDPADLDNKTITFSSKSWTIKNHQAIHAPTGQAEGEYRLVLEEA